MIKVVAALIRKDDKVLIAKRKTGNEALIRMWEFPGGKVEEGENEEKALEREILEEFEVKIEVHEFLTNNVHEYPDVIIDLRLYDCKYIDGSFKLNDHSEYKWISVDELKEYDLAPADVPFIKYLVIKMK